MRRRKDDTWRTLAGGSIRKDDNGRWYFVVDLAVPGARRRQVRQRGFATKKSAQEKLDELKGTISKGEWVEASEATVAEYLDEWLTTIKVSREPST